MSLPLLSTELLVIGAGPAGLAAAAEASRAGVRTLVIDDNRQPGGQIYRQVPPQFETSPALERGRDLRKGRSLLGEARANGVEFRLGCTAWGSFEPRVVEIVDDAGEPARIRADRLVIAAGAHDRPVPIPGWTLPGVFTVGGAQALLKSQHVLPGRRMVLAGVGPLLLVVASQLATAGVEVAAVVEPVSAWRHLGILPVLGREWPLLRDGIRYRASLVRRRVPWRAQSTVVRIEGEDRVSAAWIARVDAEWHPIPGTERRVEADAVAIGYGLLPSTELPRLCGCDVRYESDSGTWIPVRSGQFESTVPGIYIVGDGAGVAGAVVAVEEGRVAGLAAAESLERLSRAEAEKRTARSRRRLERLERVRRAVDRAYALQPGLHVLADADTIVCRCEEVRFGDLERAVIDGADTPAVLKSFTRCGMGACQARMCGAATGAFLSRRLGLAPEAVGLPPVAPPAKAIVTLQALAAE